MLLLSHRPRSVVVYVDIPRGLLQLVEHGFHVKKVLLTGDPSVTQSHKRCPRKVEPVACGRNAEERTRVKALEIPMLDNFVPLAKGVHHRELNVGKAVEVVFVKPTDPFDADNVPLVGDCLLYTSPSPRD